MKKKLFAFVLIALLSIRTTSACNYLITPTLQPETTTPKPVASPTKTDTPFPTSTQTVTLVPVTKTPKPTKTPEFAPYCGSESVIPSGCQLPIAEDSGAVCAKKHAYNLVFTNQGATFEVLNNEFQIGSTVYNYIRCVDAGIRDGRQMVTCTGPMTFYYELRVCDSACVMPSGTPESTKCPQDYYYNDLQGCCAENPPEFDQGCVLLKLNIPTCVVYCAGFSNKKACTNYGYACRWNNTENECYLRR